MSGPVRAREWDLAAYETLAERWAELVREDGDPDVLVNCAGFMELRDFRSTPWDLGERLLRVDLIAPMRLMHLAAPAMAARRAGCVVNVSSMAGRVPMRGCAFYGAAKAGLALASENAALDLAPHGVHVVTVFPGPVRTALEQRARSQVRDTRGARLIPTGDPVVLARRIVAACLRGRRWLVYPAIYVLGDRYNRLGAAVTSAFSPAPLE
ncbi:MAG: SDR family NAD(P)-dependent oxidoreductase [Deltaproteobacteria bacterium]|nr:SDR family NAD(P)-dependent oxidoreductase [Deltaproteobacteria bacterium]